MFSPYGSRKLSTTQFVALVALLRFAAAAGLCFALIVATTNPARMPVDRTAPPRWDPSRFLINAFVVPALEPDQIPLRWIDPRLALHCGPNTTVHVDGKPLQPGRTVPVQPFEVAWQMKDCRPFGFDGPRFDGAVTLTVYREDWGFSAGVVPVGLRYTWPDGKGSEVHVRAATMPQYPHADDPD